MAKYYQRKPQSYLESRLADLGQADWSGSEEYVHENLDEAYKSLAPLGAQARVVKKQMLEALEMADGYLNEVPGAFGFGRVNSKSIYAGLKDVGVNESEYELVRLWLGRKYVFYPDQYIDIMLKLSATAYPPTFLRSFETKLKYILKAIQQAKFNPATAMNYVFLADPDFYMRGAAKYGWPRPKTRDPVTNVTNDYVLPEVTGSAMQEARENVEATENVFNPFSKDFLGIDGWGEYKNKILLFGGLALAGLVFLPAMLRGMGESAGRKIIGK